MERRLPFILIAAGIALFLASFLFFALPKACAAEVANNSLDKIVTLYRDKASSWENTLNNYALTLFFLLAAIEFAVSAIRLAFRGSDASEWLAELVNQVLFLGFFLALLTIRAPGQKRSWTAFAPPPTRPRSQAADRAILPRRIFSIQACVATLHANDARSGLTRLAKPRCRSHVSRQGCGPDEALEWP